MSRIASATAPKNQLKTALFYYQTYTSSIRDISTTLQSTVERIGITKYNVWYSASK